MRHSLALLFVIALCACDDTGVEEQPDLPDAFTPGAKLDAGVSSMDSQLDAASVADATTAKMAHCQLGFEIERLPDAGPPAIGAYWTVVNPPELKVLDGGVTRLALSSIARLIS